MLRWARIRSFLPIRVSIAKVAADHIAKVAADHTEIVLTPRAIGLRDRQRRPLS